MHIEDGGEQAVVRCKESPSSGFHGDGPAAGADSRVDDGYDNRCRRKIGESTFKQECAFRDVLGCDGVREVYDAGFGCDGEDDPFHLSDVGVLGAEVGHEYDGGWVLPGMHRLSRGSSGR